MKIWELLGGLLSLIALVLWIRWLLTPSSSASWPRKIQLRVPFLYIIPAFLLAFGAMGVTEFALSIGALENLEAFTYGISALVMFPLIVVGLLSVIGVPAPPFLVPRWIREQDREHRRLKRTARRRRWQDPKVKRAEIREAISIPIIVVSITAAVLFVAMIAGNLLFTDG